MIGNVVLLLLIIWFSVRLFGELFVETSKGIIAAFRSGNLSLISHFFWSFLAAIVALIVVQNTWQMLLPVAGVTYVPIPLIEEAAEWVIDSLNTLLSLR